MFYTKQNYFDNTIYYLNLYDYMVYKYFWNWFAMEEKFNYSLLYNSSWYMADRKFIILN